MAASAGAALAGLLVWGGGHGGSHGHGAGDATWSGHLLFCGGWLLMTRAMMLPTSVPLLVAVRRVAAARPDPRRMVLLVVAGYLAVWEAAGVVARAASLAAPQALASTPLAETTAHGSGHPSDHRPIVWTAVVFLAAGGFQLSPYAERCLRACRSPFGFLARGWTGRGDVHRQALRIGVAYGRSCLGCCAALMAVLLVVGMANPAWMLARGVVMAVQKNSQAGERIARVSGGLLITTGLLLGLSG